MKKILSFILVTILVFSIVGCSSNSKNEMYVPGNGVAMDSVVNNGDGIFGGTSTDKSESTLDKYPEEVPSTDADDEAIGEYEERKIVYTVTTELQTKDFDAATKVINDGINKNDGYVQSQKETNNSDISNKYSRRYLTMVVRVPSKNLDAFLTELQNESMYTLSLSKDSKDYSSTYYDKEIRIKNLEIQEERLLEMLQKASDLKTMLDLEDRLTNIRYQIESLTKEINFIDSNVEYSTVTIRMSEVVEYEVIVDEPATFFERIGEAFSDSWKDFADRFQDFAVWFVYSLPTILILSLVTVIIVIIIKKRVKKKNIARKNQNIDNSNSSKSENK